MQHWTFSGDRHNMQELTYQWSALYFWQVEKSKSVLFLMVGHSFVLLHCGLEGCCSGASPSWRQWMTGDEAYCWVPNLLRVLLPCCTYITVTNKYLRYEGMKLTNIKIVELKFFFLYSSLIFHVFMHLFGYRIWYSRAEPPELGRCSALSDITVMFYGCTIYI